MVDLMGIEHLPKAYGLFMLFGGVGFLLSSPLLGTSAVMLCVVWLSGIGHLSQGQKV